MSRNGSRMDAVDTVVKALQEYQRDQFREIDDYQAFADVLETAGKIAMEGVTVKVMITPSGS